MNGGEKSGLAYAFHDGPGGLLLVGAENGLFQYDGIGIAPVEGEEKTGLVHVFQDGPNGLLLMGAENGLFRVSFEPLAKRQHDMDNWSELQETSPSRFGIPTRWTMTNPCSAVADQLGLHVVATDAAGKDAPPVKVHHIDHAPGIASFEVLVPVSEPGDWTFRLVSEAATRGTVSI